MFSLANRFSQHAGGRYHATLLACCAAELGHRVTIATNMEASFWKDVSQYFDLTNLDVCIDPYFGNGNDKYKNYDLFVGLPTIGGDAAAHFGTWAHKPAICMILESPLWWERVMKQPAGWDDWRTYRIAIDNNKPWILDTTLEGSKHTRDWLGSYPNKFLQLYAPVNDRACMAAKKNTKKDQVLFIARLASYKGYIVPFQLLAKYGKKYKLVIIAGWKSEETVAELDAASQKYGVDYELKFLISEQEKFEIIKQSRLLIFNSLFEGFGYPPVEAAFCLTPCVCYDLPVTKEIHCVDGNSMWPKIVERGNVEQLQSACDEILTSYKTPTKNVMANALYHYTSKYSIESCKANLSKLIEKVTA